MKRIRLLLTAAGLIAFGGQTLPARAAPPAGYRLAWADEFNGTTLDVRTWNHHGLGIRSPATHATEAVTVKDGQLIITTYTANGTNYIGMLDTKGKFERSFGYYEARIKFEDSPGMWSAFWIQTPTVGEPLGNPAVAGVEIDICEHRVTDRTGSNLVGRVQQTLHWDVRGKNHKSKALVTDDLGLAQGFHTYGLEWRETGYRFFIDGKPTWTVNAPISKRPEFVLLSSEARDKSWAGNIPAGGYGNRATSQTRMVVDYVRFYEKE